MQLHVEYEIIAWGNFRTPKTVEVRLFLVGDLLGMDHVDGSNLVRTWTIEENDLVEHLQSMGVFGVPSQNDLQKLSEKVVVSKMISTLRVLFN